MRLTKVRVTKLFGLFDHEIPLNLEERVTIIHGPNGFGKTVVLRMIEALLSGRYELFTEVPFEIFSIDTDAETQIVLSREEKTLGATTPPGLIDFSVTMVKIGSEPRSWDKPSFSPWRTVSATALEISRDVYTKWLLAGEGFPVSGRLIESLAAFERDKHAPIASQQDPEWLAMERAQFPGVRLIRTQRLDTLKPDEDAEGKKSRPTVQAYSEDLSTRIQQALADYATRAQELDRTFPSRLLSRTAREPLTAEALGQRLASLEQKRTGLTKLGFLEPESDSTLNQATTQAIETKRDVLTVYVDDMESKLAMFDELAEKIQLFTRIINDRFLLKSLAIHREQGFVFSSVTGARLSPVDLSSGEQHELILFYELLFQMKKQELVLIDEPEISLHVAWQEKFLEDLSAVVKLSEIDVVIATHSPEIIGEHWDLTVELKAPAELSKG